MIFKLILGAPLVWWIVVLIVVMFVFNTWRDRFFCIIISLFTFKFAYYLLMSEI